MTQYFNARLWSAAGFNQQQVRFLEELIDKLNLVETGATADLTAAEIATLYDSEVDVVSQVDAEAGISTTAYRWTPARVAQAIAALETVEAFPVGAVFVSVSSTNPATSLGYGTWSAFGAGRVLVGLDSGDTDFDTVEETGGSKVV